MELRTLFVGLGGLSRVAARLGVTPAAVGNWQLEGRIPAARELEVWIMASEAGLDWAPARAEGFTLVALEKAA